MNNIVDILEAHLMNDVSILCEALEKEKHIESYVQEKAKQLAQTPRGLALYSIIMEQLKGVLKNA